jgi:hypothetical protein
LHVDSGISFESNRDLYIEIFYQVDPDRAGAFRGRYNDTDHGNKDWI